MKCHEILKTLEKNHLPLYSIDYFSSCQLQNLMILCIMSVNQAGSKVESRRNVNLQSY